MRKLLIGLLLIIPLACQSNYHLVVISGYKAEVSVSFSPKGGCQDAIIEQIDSAKSSIHIAMYYFTSHDLAEALVKAKKKGVTIKVILDKGQKGNKKGRQGEFLIDNNIPVSYAPSSGIMHHKFAVIDKSIVITGSYNWTPSAETRNNENLLIIQSPDIAKRYIKVWDSLCKR